MPQPSARISDSHPALAHSGTLRVRNVTLSAADEPRAYREKLARIILDDMVQFVGLLAADGTLLEVNEAALEGAGLRLEDVRGKPFWQARWWQTSPDSSERARELIERAARGEFVRCDFVVYGRGHGSETIVCDFSLRPISDEDGNVVLLVAEGRDITEKALAEAEIERKNEELQRLLDRIRALDQIKTDFFANASHELRTPLALILGPVESLLHAGTNLTDGQRRDLSVVHRNASTLLKHVNDLLDVAKLDAAEMTLTYARVDVARELRTIVAHFDAMAMKRAVVVEIGGRESLEAEIDGGKFARIVLNLLSNAFKFTPPGGRIGCAIEVADGDRLRLVVQDTGPGVPPELRGAIFERFRQGQSGTTREFGGTGLGLAIVKEFIELHAGTIAIDEAPGGGARFAVELPLRAPNAARVRVDPGNALAETSGELAAVLEELEPVEAPVHARTGPSDGPVVLVAEDNAEMRRFLIDVLGEDYRIVAAADGAEALEKAISSPPDLVVTDLMMPRLGGDGLVREMRAHPELARVPVLVLSARADEELRVRLLTESVQDYVIKPFSSAELRARVGNLVTMKRARETLQAALSTREDDLVHLASELAARRRSLKRSLEARRESESRWRAVFENTAVGIALTDPDGRILAANAAFQRMMGYDGDELRSIRIEDLTPEEEHEAARARMARLISGELPEYRVERHYRRKDGELVWTNVYVSTVPPTATRPLMLLKLVEDIGERKKAELELADMRTVMTRVSRVTAMGELAASIAHEVNQPLAAVATNASACLRWLAAASPDLDEARQAAARIIDDASRASEVIVRTRAFLRQGELERRAVRIQDVLVDVAELVRGEAGAHGVAIVVRPAESLPEVSADCVQIQQVVLNLALNAIEALSDVAGRPRRLECWVERFGADALRVALSDNGVGMSDVQREHVFDAFFTTKKTGMGMGLAISRSIIEAHGGRLWATANEDAGETFSFTLPIEVG